MLLIDNVNKHYIKLKCTHQHFLDTVEEINTSFLLGHNNHRFISLPIDVQGNTYLFSTLECERKLYGISSTHTKGEKNPNRVFFLINTYILVAWSTRFTSQIKKTSELRLASWATSSL